MILPKILVSSVKRCAKSRETHGNLYVINLLDSSFSHISELKSEINDEGRGGSRGFRGIVQNVDKIFVAKDKSILVMDKKFKQIYEIIHPMLGSVHELCIFKNTLYCASTAFDSIIAFDVNKYKFKFGLRIKNNKAILLSEKDDLPNRDVYHINNVFCNDFGIYICGTQMDHVWKYCDNVLTSCGRIPRGTHNAHPFGDNILCNDTVHNRILLVSKRGKIIKSVNITVIKTDMLKNFVNDRIARQPFARGLAYNDDILVGGSSPDMISVYDLNSFKLIKEINLSYDITNAIHGIIILN